jgi:hypothetical protein
MAAVDFNNFRDIDTDNDNFNEDSNLPIQNRVDENQPLLYSSSNQYTIKANNSQTNTNGGISWYFAVFLIGN